MFKTRWVSFYLLVFLDSDTGPTIPTFLADIVTCLSWNMPSIMLKPRNM